MHLRKGENEEAILFFNQANLFLKDELTNYLLGWAYYHSGNYEQALVYLKQYHKLYYNGLLLNTAITEAYLANTYMKMGTMDKSNHHKQNLITRQQRGDKNVDIPLAMIAAARGEKKETLKWLEKAYNNQAYWFIYLIQMDPIFDFLRSNERFIDLVTRPGFDI